MWAHAKPDEGNEKNCQRAVLNRFHYTPVVEGLINAVNPAINLISLGIGLIHDEKETGLYA